VCLHVLEKLLQVLLSAGTAMKADRGPGNLIRLGCLLSLLVVVLGLLALWWHLSYEVYMQGLIGWSVSEVEQEMGPPQLRVSDLRALSRITRGRLSSRPIEKGVLVYRYGWGEMAMLYVDQHDRVNGVYLGR